MCEDRKTNPYNALNRVLAWPQELTKQQCTLRACEELLGELDLGDAWVVLKYLNGRFNNGT